MQFLPHILVLTIKWNWDAQAKLNLIYMHRMKMDILGPFSLK